MGQVTIEIEGHKSKRDFFYSRMQESEEREQINKVTLDLYLKKYIKKKQPVSTHW